MTREDIIRMAREAASDIGVLIPSEWNKPLLERFAALVAAAEREACADLCYKNQDENIVMTHGVGKRLDLLCSEAIRARGEQ